MLLVLPAAIAMRVLALPAEWVGAGVAFLGAALGGVKLMAMAWAIGGRFITAHPVRAVAAPD
ncbi:MAG TPA: hypothetical protein VN965_10040 [Candidatus Dormibacteraeota bacterium]|nr:hypothetical protein [Candidatus Dormibacteraeota bacterium]